MELWNFAERQETVLAAVRRLVHQDRIPSAILSRIEACYAQGLAFEAERIAGLAIWVGQDAGQETPPAFFGQFGSVLRALQRVSTGLRSVDRTPTGDHAATSRADCIAAMGLSPAFSERLCQLSAVFPASLPTRLAVRGARLQQMVEFLAGETAMQAERNAEEKATDAVPRTAIEDAAEQAATTLLAIGRQLWQVRAGQEWQPVSESYEAFLETRLGLSMPFGRRLGAIGQVWTDTPLQRAPLRRLEMLCTLAAGRVTENDSSSAERTAYV